ncbi:MAG: nucleotidyltransferase family protein [Candidatus Dormibacteria bacterium]
MRPVPLTAIILCGGQGTRLRSSVADRPKALATIAGRPFLDWLLWDLSDQGIRQVVLAVGHRAAQVREHAGNGKRWGVTVAYSEEDSPLGTGGAVGKAMHSTGGEEFLVMNGDSYCGVRVNALIRTHKVRQAVATITVVPPMADSGRFGSVSVSESWLVTGFGDTRLPGSKYISAGIYLMSRGILKQIPDDQPSSLERDLLPRLVGEKLVAFLAGPRLVDIGTADSYKTAAGELAQMQSFARLQIIEQSATT